MSGFCTACGSHMSENAEFCVRCGSAASTPAGLDVAPVAVDVSASDQEASRKPRISKSMVVAIAALVFAVIALILGVLGFLVSGRGADSDSLSVGLLGAPAEPAQEHRIESSWGYAEIPLRWNGKAVCEESDGIFRASSVDGRVVCAEILLSGSRLRENEAKCDAYRIGSVETATGQTDVLLFVYYVNEKGEHVHWNAQGDFELGLQYCIDATVEEFASCLFLESGDSYVPAVLDSTSSEPGALASTSEESGRNASSASSASDGEAHETTPFWGVWVGAARDREGTASFVSNLESAGFSSRVELTTDWENLNSEAWYAVTAGPCALEEAANELLVEVREAGFSDAYVKFSGPYRE